MSDSRIGELAQQDLDALKKVREAAVEKAAQAGKSVYGPEALNTIRRQQYEAYREIAAEAFSVRIDATNERGVADRFYLTKARQGLFADGLKVVSWTAPLARLRVLDPGEDEDIRVGPNEISYRLSLKAKFQPVKDDLENGRYESNAGITGYSSAKEVAAGIKGQGPQAAFGPPPQRREPGDFGLREIIFETDRIQDDQLRMPLTGHLVIEGAPGSGKTSIALQRAVYVIEEQYDELNIDREKPFFTDDSTLVLTYNEILVNYLERLLKELRIPQVPVQSVAGWTKDLLDGAHALDSVKRQKLKDTRALTALKTHPLILEPLRRHVASTLQENWSRGGVILDKGLAEVFGRSKSRRQAYLDEFEEGARHLRAGRLGLSHLVNLFKISRDEFVRERDSQEANALRGVLAKCASTTVDYGTMYLSFLQSNAFEAHAKQMVGAGLISATAATKAVREARRHARDGYIRKNDLALLGWIVRWLSDGVPESPVVQFTKPWHRVSHLVMDEVQDLSPIECRLLLELLEPRFRCVTAVGDLMQRLNYPGGLPSWPDGGFMLNGSEGRMGVFRKNYRQSTELGILAMDYYRAHFGEPVPFEARPDNHGLKPELLTGSDAKARIGALADRLIELRRLNPTWSIVVLCDDDDLRETAAKVLGPRLREHHIRCRRSKAVDLRDRATVHITPTLHTKGLEFDCVCILEPGRVSKKMSAEQILRSTYVAMTRAGRHLMVTAGRELPATLEPIAQHFAHVAVRDN